jgi:hypothetical protein
MTPATPLGFTNIAFADDRDTVTLMWTGAKWAIVGFADVGADIVVDLIDVAA